MKYIVLMYADPAATERMSAAERADVFRRHEALHRDLAGTGEMPNGAGLAYPKDTTSIHWRPDGLTTTNGPFIEAAEQLTAYCVIDCVSQERARAIAERVLDFHVTGVEVRPVHDSFGMGDTLSTPSGRRPKDSMRCSAGPRVQQTQRTYVVTALSRDVEILMATVTALATHREGSECSMLQ